MVRATSHRGLSTTYTGPSTTVPTVGLASEHRKVGIGPQASFQLRRLSIRPPVRSGPTDTGQVAKPTGKDTRTHLPTGLFSAGADVFNRPANRDRETSSPRPTTHEAHSVAPQKKLENTGIPTQTDPSAQISASSLAMVAARRQRSHRPTTTPSTACPANLYRRIKRRVGRSLKRAYCQRILVPTGKQIAHKLLGVKSSLSGSKRVPKGMHRQNGASCNRQYHRSSLYQQGRRHEVGPTLCLLWRILTWCTGKQVTLRARHIPGHLNVVADKLSRLGQTIQTEWSLLPEIFQALCDRWHQPQIDLFATRFNNKLPCSYHRYRTPGPLQWMHSVCHGKIWTHTPSHQQPFWAKWWRSCKTPRTGG